MFQRVLSKPHANLRVSLYEVLNHGFDSLEGPEHYMLLINTGT